VRRRGADAPVWLRFAASVASMGAVRNRYQSELLSALLALVRGIDRVHSSGALVERSGVSLERGLHPVLMTIAALEPIRTTELATALALKSSTVSRHAARLEHLGLLERSVDPADGRASLLALSAEGRDTLAVLSEAWDEILGEQLALAGDGEPRALAAEIQKLVRALELLPYTEEASVSC
jgi:DNA-binding MarR family transcriptional regulator